MQNDDIFKGIKNIEDILCRLERHAENAKALKELKKKAAAESSKEVELREHFPIKINCPQCGEVIVAKAFLTDTRQGCTNCGEVHARADESISSKGVEPGKEAGSVKEKNPGASGTEGNAEQRPNALNSGQAINVAPEVTPDPGAPPRNPGPTLSVTLEGQANQGMDVQELGPTLSVTLDGSYDQAGNTQDLGPTLNVTKDGSVDRGARVQDLGPTLNVNLK